MPHLLDSNACVQHLRGRCPPISKRLLALRTGDAATCPIVRAELCFGAIRSAQPEYELARARQLLDAMTSYPFDNNAAEEAARIRARLAGRGTPIGPHDLQIAAVAITHDLTLVTHNTGEFGRVEGLRMVDWEVLGE